MNSYCMVKVGAKCDLHGSCQWDLLCSVMTVVARTVAGQLLMFGYSLNTSLLQGVDSQAPSLLFMRHLSSNAEDVISAPLLIGNKLLFVGKQQVGSSLITIPQ